MTDLLTCREAAEHLGIDLLQLVDIISIGDIPPSLPVGLTGAEAWARCDEIRLSDADIDSIRAELRRRRFEDFRRDYGDIYTPDPRPSGRGLEFGPGWTGILRELCDSLREFQAAGYRADLRWGKEKFGGLKLFTEHADEISTYVSERRGIAYGKSLQTCQECGQSGRLRFGYSVCLTLCEKHSHIVGEPDPTRDGIILDLDAWTREQQ